MNPSKPLYHRRRFPAEIISHCVGLYFRFCLRYRDVEEIMAKRGVVVTDETIRDWSQKCGGIYVKRLRSRTPRPGDRWPLDEVYLSIHGKLGSDAAAKAEVLLDVEHRQHKRSNHRAENSHQPTRERERRLRGY